MKLWHFGAQAHPNATCGVTQSVWALAEVQARSGHEVALAVGAVGEIEQQAAKQAGIRFVDLRRLDDCLKPDILHMHSVFTPRLAMLSRWARARNIPVVISPRGGVAPQVLSRGRIKKSTYSTLVERPRFRRAQAIHALLHHERDQVLDFVGRGCPPVFVVPNPISVPDPETVESRDVEDVVFLGRLDTLPKGLDRFAFIAESLPELSFGIYGTEAGVPLPQVPANVQLHGPVYGEDKWAVLKSTRLYMHLARWEAFGRSVFEAAWLGADVCVSTEISAASIIAEWGGLVVDTNDLDNVAKQVRGRVGSNDHRAPSSLMRNARSFCSPTVVQEALADEYVSVLGGYGGVASAREMP